jgi:D-xylose 1-dehydrogenase (NADP+, D-xylono-1,5-lactone-forming)
VGHGPPPLRWGVIAASAYVAQQAVLPAIATSENARLVAVASQSRSAGTLDAFGALRTYRSYADLLADPEVEAVYVPLPNSLHREWVERAAAEGKHVLCEKPLAPSATDARAMRSACAAGGVFLLEAYMSPFHPRSAAVDALVRSGRLGALRFARAAFTGVLTGSDNHRWRPDLKAGALLDVGIYCVAPLLIAAGRPPRRVQAAAVMTPAGVDSACSGWLDFGDGFSAAIECSFDAPENQSLEIVGTEAAVIVSRAYTPGPADIAFTLRSRDGRLEQIVVGGGNPYLAMVEHFQAAVRGTVTSGSRMVDSIARLEVLDRLRDAAGLGRAALDAVARGVG